MILSINLEIGAGSDFYDTYEEALHLAIEHHAKVTYKFNGFLCEVTSCTPYTEIYAEYDAYCKAETKAFLESEVI